MDDEQLPPGVIPQTNYGFPVNQSLEYTELMIKPELIRKDPNRPDSDDNILEGDLPPDMVKFFWGFLNPDIILSNLNDRDVKMMLMDFQVCRKIYIVSRSPESFTFDSIRQLDNLESRVHARIKRAYHGFERHKLTEQTQQQIYGTVNTPDSNSLRDRVSRGFNGIVFGGK